MSIKHLMVAGAFTVCASFAAVVTAGETTEDQFTKLDADADGVISAEEATADEMLTKDWSLIDANQDGQVERAEFSAFEEMSKTEGMGTPATEEVTKETAE